MGINLVIAVTDGDRFDMLRQRRNFAEVDFMATVTASSPARMRWRVRRPGRRLGKRTARWAQGMRARIAIMPH